MLSSEHVYCVAVTFKMTEWVEQQICIKFCIKLEHSSTETIQMIQKTTAPGNWWLAALSQQCSCIMSHAEFFLWNIKSPRWLSQSPYSPELAPCVCWLFPKLKASLKGKRFQAVNEIQENKTGQLMVIGRTVWGPRSLLWTGLRHHCPMYNVSCILYLLQ